MHIKTLAELSGTSERTMIRYLNGERDIPVTTLSMMADALGLSPADIFTRAIERIKK